MPVIMPAAMLNRTCTITRPADPSTSDASGVPAVPTIVSAVAKVRIYQNEDYSASSTGQIEEQGIVAASSHKAVTGPTEDVEAGDTLTDNSTTETFIVNLVDSMPAGHSGSHRELWLTSSEFK